MTAIAIDSNGRLIKPSRQRPALRSRSLRRAAFTLIELMVVCGMLAIFAAILLPNFTLPPQQAQTAASKTNLDEIATVVTEYFTDNGSYPAGTAANVNAALFGGAGNVYMNQTPLDPTDQADYTYTNPAASGAPYEIDAPGTYSSSTLTTILTAAGAACTTCTHLHYTPYLGIYGS